MPNRKLVLTGGASDAGPIGVSGTNSGAFRRFAFDRTDINLAGGPWAQETIFHGLGTTPVAVLLTADYGECFATCQNITSTSFVATLKRADGTTLFAGQNIVNWLALAF